MFSSRICQAIRRSYVELDYSRHFPREYVDRVKRIVPKKIYDNRFGAPPVIRWTIPLEHYNATTSRPWEMDIVKKSIELEQRYHSRLLAMKFFKHKVNRITTIPNEEWMFFPGDLVQVMIGKDKGRKGIISHIIRERNAVFVDGLHTILEKKVETSKALGVKNPLHAWKMQPLFVDKEQVKLVDPNDNEPCTAKWAINNEKTDYIRISSRTGYQIPLPSQAAVTYEYISPGDYIEVPGKDTTAKMTLKKTYVPKLNTFEQELEEVYNLMHTDDHKPTYWY